MSPLLQLAVLALAWLVIGAMTSGVGLLVLPLIYWALVLRGSEGRAVIAQRRLQGALMKHETLIASALQMRIGALLFRRRLMALTTSRAVVITRGLFGGFTVNEHQWKDLRDATLRENMLPLVFGSRIALSSGAGAPSCVIHALPGDVAARMYAHAQAEEQAWEERKHLESKSLDAEA